MNQPTKLNDEAAYELATDLISGKYKMLFYVCSGKRLSYTMADAINESMELDKSVELLTSLVKKHHNNSLPEVSIDGYLDELTDYAAKCIQSICANNEWEFV